MTEPETTEEGATGAPDLAATVWPEDERDCTTCGKRRPHTIRRINLQGAPQLCDPCFDERKTP